MQGGKLWRYIQNKSANKKDLGSIQMSHPGQGYVVGSRIPCAYASLTCTPTELTLLCPSYRLIAILSSSEMSSLGVAGQVLGSALVGELLTWVELLQKERDNHFLRDPLHSDCIPGKMFFPYSAVLSCYEEDVLH